MRARHGGHLRDSTEAPWLPSPTPTPIETTPITPKDPPCNACRHAPHCPWSRHLSSHLGHEFSQRGKSRCKSTQPRPPGAHLEGVKFSINTGTARHIEARGSTRARVCRDFQSSVFKSPVGAHKAHLRLQFQAPLACLATHTRAGQMEAAPPLPPPPPKPLHHHDPEYPSSNTLALPVLNRMNQF